jgi:hypothetical protein
MADRIRSTASSRANTVRQHGRADVQRLPDDAVRREDELATVLRAAPTEHRHSGRPSP